MFGNTGGMSGIGAWQGQPNNNMNPEVLAQTLVNVAQNLLSSQQQPQQNDNYNRGPGHGESGIGRMSPWVTSDDQLKFRHTEEDLKTTIRPKPMMGMGLLGAPPDGDYRAVRDRDPVFVIQDQNHSGGDRQGGFGIGEDMFRKKINNKGQVTEKSRKNYRPKIKEEGFPPKYELEEFNHLHSKHFCCDLCDKKMWNSLSFVNHVKGNAHNKLVEDKIAEEAFKTGEVRKLIAELIKKDNGKPLPGRQGICHMCGLRVKGDMLKHRKEDYHQKLKTFIHPHCKVCDADFEDRSEWHYHKFSAEHLSNIEGSRHGLAYDPMGFKELENMLVELKKRIGKGSIAELKKKNKLSKETKADTSEQPSRTKETQKQRMSKKFDQKVVNDSKPIDDDVIIVEDDSVSEKDLEPIMQEAEILGAEFIKPVNGLFCKLCKKFFGSGDESLRQHCKSQHHLQMYRDQTGGVSTPGIKRSKAAEFFSPKKKK